MTFPLCVCVCERERESLAGVFFVDGVCLFVYLWM